MMELHFEPEHRLAELLCRGLGLLYYNENFVDQSETVVILIIYLHESSPGVQGGCGSLGLGFLAKKVVIEHSLERFRAI